MTLNLHLVILAPEHAQGEAYSIFSRRFNFWTLPQSLVGFAYVELRSPDYRWLTLTCQGFHLGIQICFTFKPNANQFR
jgi:hypothetical protein